MSHTITQGRGAPKPHATRRGRAALAVCGLTAATAIPLATSGPAQAAPYCGIHWGSTAKARAASTADTVRNVRTGRHACYDRLVVDLSGHGASSGYRVQYVSTVRGPSGKATPLAGGAHLQIDLHAKATNSIGTPTYRPGDPAHVANVTGYRTFRQVAYVATFEGHTTLGVGVRARLPMRVFVLQDPGGQRLVIDVAHRW